MNEKFEYYINKVIIKVFFQLIAFIIFTVILITLGIIFKSEFANFDLLLIFIIVIFLSIIGIIINYISYKRNIWLLNNYQTEPEKVIFRIRKYKKDVETYNYGLTTYLFDLFNKNSFLHYDEAIKALKEKM